MGMPVYRATASAIRHDGDPSTVTLEYHAPNLIDAWIVAERMADGWADTMGLREPQAMFVKIEEE